MTIHDELFAIKLNICHSVIQTNARFEGIIFLPQIMLKKIMLKKKKIQMMMIQL